jgi:hypothetical protein
MCTHALGVIHPEKVLLDRTDPRVVMRRTQWIVVLQCEAVHG